MVVDGHDEHQCDKGRHSPDMPCNRRFVLLRKVRWIPREPLLYCKRTVDQLIPRTEGVPMSKKPKNDPIGDTLRRQRIEVLGRGLREMAGILEIAPAHLTDLEKGRRAPSEDLLHRISKHYQMDIAVLRAGWSKPDAVVAQIASQDATTSAKTPEFLRAARTLDPQQWDELIARAKRMAASSRRSEP